MDSSVSFTVCLEKVVGATGFEDRLFLPVFPACFVLLLEGMYSYFCDRCGEIVKPEAIEFFNINAVENGERKGLPLDLCANCAAPVRELVKQLPGAKVPSAVARESAPA